MQRLYVLACLKMFHGALDFAQMLTASIDTGLWRFQSERFCVSYELEVLGIFHFF